MKSLAIGIVAVIAVLISSACPADEAAHITILQTSDLHGCLLQEKEAPGFLKLASLIRKEYESSSTLLIDCGDSFQGSFENAATKGAIMPPAINALSYDAWIPGNHDFDWGAKRFMELAGQLKTQKLAANLEIDGKQPEGFLAWTLFERKGVKIAVIGMTSPHLDKWLWGESVRGIQAQGLAEALDRTMPELIRSRPDIIVMAVHAGKFSPERLGGEDGPLSAIAKSHPEIDIILGGHSHMQEPGERLGAKTWFAQAGQHGEALLKVEILFESSKRRIVSLSSQLLKPDAFEKPDTETSVAVAPLLAKTQAEAVKEAGRIDSRLGPANKRKSSANSLNDLLCKAMAEASGAQAAFHGAQSMLSLGPGAISEAELFTAAPYENEIGVLMLSPSQCREIIEEQLSIEEKALRLRFWGIEFKAGADGKLVGELRLADGSIWDDESRRVKVAFSGYDLASGGGRCNALARIARDPACKAFDAGMTTRQALRLALARKPADI